MGSEGPRKARPLVEDANSKFARALGSTDFHTREAGLRALQDYLSRRTSVDELELLKLWKGVFYCFWHSDKGPVQTALAERLSEIMTQLPEEVSWLFYTTFVRTMRREWFGIDRLRLDKFLMLIRKFFAASLRQLQAHSWQPRRVQRLADFWLSDVLVPSDTVAAAGVAFHLTDLLLPELAVCVQQGGGQAPDDATLRALLEPFCRALAAASTPAMIHRLRQGVFDLLVGEVRQPAEGGALQQLDAAALAAHIFDMGAQAETKARNREALYAISSALEKAAAAAAKQHRQPGKQGADRKAAKSGAKKARNAAQVAEPQQHAAPMEADKQHAQQHAPNGLHAQGAEQSTPVSSKKGKKRRQEAEAREAATPPAAAATPQPSGPPPSSSKQKKRSRLGPPDAAEQHIGQEQPHDVPAEEQNLLAAALAAVTGSGAAAHTPGGGVSPSKKSVRFSLKRNLVNVIGQPPKPADVRTPPTAKPKGPALKKDSAFGGPASAPERLLTRAGVNRMAQFQTFMNGRAAPTNGGGSASKADGAAGKKQKRRASMPAQGSFSRPRASEFF